MKLLTKSQPAILLFLCIVVFSLPMARATADQATSDPSLMAKAANFLIQVSSKWSAVQTLKYEVDTKDTESPAFRQSINETGHDRDILLTHLSFSFKGAEYGWKSDTLVQATGTHERVSTGGYKDGTLSVLFQGPHSVLMVTQNPKLQSAVPITGCNPLMEAFSFLASDDWQGFNCPEVNLSSLLSINTWTDAAKRVTSFSEETNQSLRRIKIVFGPPSGSHDVVYFAEDINDFPVEWQHWEGTYLRRKVSMTDAMVTKLLPGGLSITLPHILTRCDYYDPANEQLTCTSEQTLNLVAVNQVVVDEDLVIDPTLADSIYDRDTDKRISVPK